MVIDEWVNNLPINNATKMELQEAVNRRSTAEWVEKRKIWHDLCAKRLEEKKDRVVRKLIYEEKIFAIHLMDETLAEIARDARALGYSANAVSTASHSALSVTWCIQYTETPDCRVRGQVVELLEDLSDFELRLWLLKGSYNTQHGKALTRKEKENILSLYHKGYSIAEVAKMLHRSPSAVRRQVAKNELG